MAPNLVWHRNDKRRRRIVVIKGFFGDIVGGVYVLKIMGAGHCRVL